ncbi:hypothetical protein [Butyricicoccus pullicaecorum]|uniref:hypothetical protein n=1 Tax=Butyricicoccus pullicaecorum TaxID=501571 RepID=UPI001177C8A0|nr:hypothetical protein [Butyricicoccus pullicaecorum]
MTGINQNNKKKRVPQDAQSSKKTVLSDGLFLVFVLIETRAEHRVSRGDFAICGWRPGSTWTGQPTRLDRAGSQTRTRLLGAS